MIRRTTTLGTLLAVLWTAPSTAQFQDRIPPTRVPQTEEPPTAKSNEVPKDLPPLPGPARSGVPSLPLTLAPRAIQPDVSDPPTPVVAIRVRVPANIAVGAATEFTITVSNPSQANAYHVRVSYPKPPNAEIKVIEPPLATEATPTLLKWYYEKLGPGEQKIIRLTFEAKDDAEVRHVARVQFEHGQQVVVKQNRPVLKVQRIAPQNVHEGEAVPVKIVIENSGRVDAQNVLISESLDEGLEHEVKDEKKLKRFWTLERLKAGERREETYVVHARKLGSFTSTIAVSATNVAEAKTPYTVVVGRPLLDVQVQGPDRVYISQPASYRVVVKNTGNIPLDNVTVVYNTKEVKVLQATQGAATFKDRIQWVIGRFEPGAERTFNVSIQSLTVGELVNIFEVLARRMSRIEKVRTTFIGAAALELRARGEPNPVAQGDKITYQVTVRNTGTKVAEGVKLDFAFPLTQMKFVQGDARLRATASGVESSLFAVRPKETVTFSLTLEATTPGLAVFRAQMTAPDLTSGPVTTSESTTITLPTK